MSKKNTGMLIAASAAIVALGVGIRLTACTSVKRGIVGMMTPAWEPEASPSGGFVATFDKLDAPRPRSEISLVPVVAGLTQPTDIQFVPGDPKLMIALEKGGAARWHDLQTKRRGLFFEVEVLTDSEQGLLGLAFHPDFLRTGRFFVNSTPDGASDDMTRIEEWAVPAGSDLRTAKPKRIKVILEVGQPYPNHNAGQLAFGPDGFLYIGLGDGGWRADPHGDGQNLGTMLGSMLRIDVNRTEPPKQYGIPKDNPFVGKDGVLPEIWAYGLRNPWRYSFDPKGRLIVADVGQDEFEEVHILQSGDNAGWKIREGRHCFEAETCETKGFVEPIFEYGREDGGSITGGYVSFGGHLPELEGKYVLADFLSGRLWAIDVPDDRTGPLEKATALGRFPFLPSTFGQDIDGRIYVGGYRSGTIWRLVPKLSKDQL